MISSRTLYSYRAPPRYRGYPDTGVVTLVQDSGAIFSDTGGQSPEGVYVGTSNGAVYGSPDGGDRWQRLPGTLPPILSVTCAEW
jgi:hypothetical protein